MHGRAHHQIGTNLRVIGFGDGTYTWQNTANGYVPKERYPSYDEAQDAADVLQGEVDNG